MPALVKRLRPETAAPGEIVDLDGRVLGAHRGRRPFHRSASAAASRSAASPSRSTWSGSSRSSAARRRPAAALAVDGRAVEQLNWLAEDQTEVERQGALARPAGAGAAWTATGCASRSPEYGVAPGQSAVFYDGERLLGGGWIAETSSPARAR